jgi:Ca2+/H+ antiporter, TMEM165/GDT1 family
MLALYGPALIVAFVITLLEMTEVVVLVFALSADHSTIAHGAAGAVSGTTTVALVALAFGALLIAFPREYLLWASALLLTGFGVFLFRSTLRTYRRARAGSAAGTAPAGTGHSAVQFAGGFTVGAIEATEAVVVLIALAAAGYAFSAVVGAVSAGVVLVIATALVHERIRRIKVPLLKLGATSMLFTFAVFWAGEAAGVNWPGSDLFLIPLFVIAIVIVRGALELRIRRTSPPAVPS